MCSSDLRNKDAFEEAPESPQIATETVTSTSRRPKQPSKSKGKTKRTVGPKVNTPPKAVVWCRKTSHCRDAHLISENKKSPVICRCGIKVLDTRSKLAATIFDSILPPKAVLVNTPTGRFVQLIFHLVLSIVIWFAIAWAVHRLLRSHSYNANFSVIFNAKRWLTY